MAGAPPHPHFSLPAAPPDLPRLQLPTHPTATTSSYPPTTMAGKQVPNLDLMSKIAGQWDAKMKAVVAKNADLRVFMGKGGVKAIIVLTRIFPMNDGPSAFSRGFEGYILNAHGAEPPDSPALVQPAVSGSEKLAVKVYYNPKADAPKAPDAMGPPPETLFLTSFTTMHFNTSAMEALDRIRPGQLALLSGVSARAYIPRNPGPWGVAYDASLIEPVRGLTLASL